MSDDPYPIDPNTDNSIDLATIIEVLADDPKVVGDRSNYFPTKGRVVKESPSGNRWLGDGSQWVSLETDVRMATPSLDTGQENSSEYWVRGDRAVDILNTIDDAGPGATIKLEAREYPLDFLDEGGLVIDTEGITIEGSGRYASGIRLEDNTTNTDEGAEILEVRADGVTFNGFYVDGNWQNNDPGEAGTVEDGHSVDVGAEDFTAYDWRSINSTGDGIEFINNSSGQMWGVEFVDNWEHNIGLNGCEQVTITNFRCVGEENNASVGFFNGPDNPNTRNVKLAHGTIEGFKNRGLNITSGGGKTVNVHVEDIDIYADQASGDPFRAIDGVGGNAPENITAENIRIYDSPVHGARIRNVADSAFRNFKIYRTQRNGGRIRNIGSDVDISDWVIEDANLGTTNNDDGINVTTDVAVENLSIDDIRARRSTGDVRDVANVVFFGGTGSFNSSSEVVDVSVDSTGTYESQVVNTDNVTYNGDVRRVGPGRREETGSETQSGDGTTSTFAIPHTLGRQPDMVNVWAESAAANGNFFVDTVNFSQVKITYDSAPASGTDNLTWGYHYRVDDV